MEYELHDFLIIGFSNVIDVSIIYFLKNLTPGLTFKNYYSLLLFA